ncbi:ParB/RepB/Spo0J family partition protein [Variovorax sp. dw_954]|uniref:ParB/RepB/Spo0J family partition protein n=1 Tax=Variovorax sp. dw_954 TaxID=2720078 RepID=UPI001BD4973D|nr:ParB/RepB/Spo0J family partition protein [Variovorax sp. dw_954]
MANKDLVKRAFSVTANLPAAPAVESTGSASPVLSANAPEPSGVIATPESSVLPMAAVGATRLSIGTPKTSPGSMMAFMTEQSEVHREVVRLREQVNAFEGADVARRLDPTQIVASKWANRDESHFSTEMFTRLKQEIASAGGNVQPIKVRAFNSPAAESARWEIVYGHRRHRACLELGIPVLALIQRDMPDADLFVEMERENREREDLSAWEQGLMYMRALELGLFPSAKQLAAAIDRDMGNISKAMALAKLPADVVRAFGSPLNLQFRWATALKDAHQRDPEGLLAAARELATAKPMPSPASVFSTLTGPGITNSRSAPTSTEWKDEQGKRLASLTFDRKGRATIAFEYALDEAQQRKLAKAVDSFLGRKG